MHPLRQAIWGLIQKRTVEKSPTHVTNVTLPLLGQTFWGDIWKLTAEKSQTNATSVVMHLLRQAIWGNIWKRTVEKRQTNSTNETYEEAQTSADRIKSLFVIVSKPSEDSHKSITNLWEFFLILLKCLFRWDTGIQYFGCRDNKFVNFFKIGCMNLHQRLQFGLTSQGYSAFPTLVIKGEQNIASQFQQIAFSQSPGHSSVCLSPSLAFQAILLWEF